VFVNISQQQVPFQEQRLLCFLAALSDRENSIATDKKLLAV
jgi:hypothetical protein